MKEFNPVIAEGFNHFCSDCGHYFNHPDMIAEHGDDQPLQACPECGNYEFEDCDELLAEVDDESGE